MVVDTVRKMTALGRICKMIMAGRKSRFEFHAVSSSEGYRADSATPFWTIF
ncbi:MAG: hypothetical protein ACI915_002398 [Gammaproteobacteria bacterium]|jgi:hypothetical protein